MTTRLKIMFYAVKIRLSKGELLDDIFASYPALSVEDKEIIKNELVKK